MSATHDYTQNVAAAKSIMRDYFPSVNFAAVIFHLEIGDFDGALSEFVKLQLGDFPNVVPHPGIVIAAEIRNAKRYYSQQEQSDAS